MADVLPFSPDAAPAIAESPSRNPSRLSTWAIDNAATQVGLPSMQSGLGISVTDSQWILNLTLMILAGFVTVGGALGDRLGRLRMFRLGILVIGAGAAITFAGQPLKVATILIGTRNYCGLVGHGGSSDTAPVEAYVAVLPSQNGGKLKIYSGSRK